MRMMAAAVECMGTATLPLLGSERERERARAREKESEIVCVCS
jgi:hypothetical protein